MYAMYASKGGPDARKQLRCNVALQYVCGGCLDNQVAENVAAEDVASPLDACTDASVPPVLSLLLLKQALMMLCSDAWYAPVSVTLHLQGHTSITPIFPVPVASVATAAAAAAKAKAAVAPAVASASAAATSAVASAASARGPFSMLVAARDSMLLCQPRDWSWVDEASLYEEG